MNDGGRLAAALDRGAAHLRRSQQANGGFITLASPKTDNFEGAAERITSFGTALILLATAELASRNKAIQAMHEQAAGFLLGQRGPSWSFNYWMRGSKLSREYPCPDDWDDTACALAALQRHRAELVGSEQLAAIVRKLTLCEVRVGGPYNTWIVPKDAPDEWHDVDLAVNCNVAYFLSLQGVQLPRLAELAEEAIRTSSYTTTYYPMSPYPVLYFISRFYRGAYVGQLQQYILDHRDSEGWWGNPLDSALATSALLNTGGAGTEVARTMDRLLETEKEGAWPAWAVHLELGQGENAYYAGSSTLTTAFVLEAMTKYEARTETAPVPSVATPLAGEAETIYEAVVTGMRERFERLEPDLRNQAGLALERQLEHDQGHDKQIGLLPYFWELSLKPSPMSVTSEELIRLGMASLCGWICYTIYDDFLDEEGSPPLLSVAHVAMRELTHLFAQLRPGDPTIAALVEGVMDRIDAANTWEVLHARATIENDEFTLERIPDYGDFGQLASRSLGHALGPLCVLLVRGYALDSPAMKHSLNFFIHYLVARQLNDDVHDWEADLTRGQVNAVGAYLLKARLSKSDAGFLRQPLRPLLDDLKKQLWAHDIVAICDRIMRHANEARQALELNPAIASTTRLAALLTPLERSAREALRERAQTQAFIAAYQPKNIDGQSG